MISCCGGSVEYRIYHVYIIRRTIYDVLFTPYTVRRTMYDVQFTPYTVRCTLYSIYCTSYNELYTRCTACTYTIIQRITIYIRQTYINRWIATTNNVWLNTLNNVWCIMYNVYWVVYILYIMYSV